MPLNFNKSSDTQIRIVSALSYMSYGIIGLLYVLFNGKDNKSQFFQFHFIQAILIGVICMLVGWAGSGLGNFIGGTFGLFGGGVATAGSYISMGIGLIMQLVFVVLMIGNVYGVIQSLRGKYADMPLVSKIVRSNLRR